jgi:hypothetical protein
MPPPVWRATLGVVDLALAMSATWKSAIVLLFTGVVAPLIGVVIRRVAGGWETIGKGPFAIEQQLPWLPRGMAQTAVSVDPAIQAAEVRQMLIAKQERQERRGESPLDVETEAERLLADPAEEPDAGERQDAELRAEVRQLVIARNERRIRQGLEPLDVEAELERQLADLVGSP